MLSFILSRLREPSTYNGFAAVIAGLAFVPHAADFASLIAPIGVVIAGLIGIVKPEAKVAAP